MVDAFLQGDVQKALQWHLLLMPVFKGMFIATNPVPVKYLLNKVGFKAGGYRLPIVGPSAAEQELLNRLMEAIRALPQNL